MTLQLDSVPPPATLPPSFTAAFLESFFAPGGVAESIPEAVIGWDRKGNIIGWNPGAEAIFGWNRERIVGKTTLYALLPYTQRKQIRGMAQRLFTAGRGRAAGRSRISAIKVLTRDERALLCAWKNALVYDEAGRVVAVISRARDITSERQWEQEQQRLRDIAAAANASLRLDDILRQVRDAVVEGKHFDRASVLLVEESRVRGSWGTDEYGALRDERDYSVLHAEWADTLTSLAPGKRKYVLMNRPLSTLTGEGGDTYPGAILGLRAGGKLIGLLCLDNLLSRRPIGKKDIATLDAFVEQTAVAIRNAALLEERSRHLERQRRLAERASALSAGVTLDDILRSVRNGAIESGGFDRAAVFLYDAEKKVITGTWGTDRKGDLEDITSVTVAPKKADTLWESLRNGLDYILYTDYTSQKKVPIGSPMYGVHAHAVVLMRAAGEIMGFLCVDNCLRDAPITGEEIECLLPFANHAAVAIQNALRLEELHRTQQALVRAEKFRADQLAATLRRLSAPPGKRRRAISLRGRRGE